MERPTHCRQGHPFGPHLVQLGWLPCSCAQPYHTGHTIYHCEHVIDGKRCGDVQIPGHVEPDVIPDG